MWHSPNSRSSTSYN
ncbi:hypothetical protein BpHYR1_021270 [Brachionus plicatilis]|uniref:Uncharacterized protein n=1 Tax=Brachionus plicatilis TaxID=10195 RepID=A0A3M7QQN1_BRAPC|nr:hypothetical protein BpHYR1_021270 [Brachionus plicatilis]